MDIGSLTPLAFVAALVWGLTQVLKQVVPLPAQVLSFVVALAVGVAAVATGYLSGASWFQMVGTVILTAIGANALHNYGFNPGLGLGSSTDTSVPADAGSGPYRTSGGNMGVR